jgi:hypothetical protein
MKVKVTFTEELLGTASGNKNIHEEFIASKAPNAASLEEEVAAIGADAVEEKTKTVFPRDDHGNPILWDYQIKGFFKDACGMLSRVEDTKSKELKAYKKVIDGLVFVTPRKIRLVLPEGGKIGDCQRPLRAQTAQGERVALANSEALPAGTTCEFEVVLLNPKLEKTVIEWLDYGKLRGFGQWRNSGKGRLVYDII